MTPPHELSRPARPDDDVALPPGSAILAGAVVETVLPTNLGRTVFVCRSPDGTRYLVKTAALEHWRDELHKQHRHFELLRERFGSGVPYPRILELGPGHMVMELYTGGSIDDLVYAGSRSEVENLVEQLLERYLQLSFDAQPAPATGAPGAANLATTFMQDQVQTRVRRLELALEQEPAFAEGVPSWSDLPRGQFVTGLVRRVRQRLADGRVESTSPLRISIHGDLGVNNVLLRSIEDRSLVFIDTRGIWVHGMPWWDPFLDLATLLVFHCRIDPCLSGCDPHRRPIHLGTGRISESLMRDLVDRSVRRHGADELVTDWRERLDLYIAVRLLGAISVQLVTAPRAAPLLADAMLRLLVDHLDSDGHNDQKTKGVT